jgi:hypothetical protein
MPYKHIHNPTKGLVTRYPPFALDNPDGITSKATPYCSGIYLSNGEVCSDWGHNALPVVTDTRTNYLNGSFMKSYQFFKTDGVTHEIALTTTQAYEFNTSTQTWDCITRGTLIDDCETAWTASADVTSTRDTTIKLRGSYSAKHVIASGFTTGIVSYFNFGAKDISDATNTHITLWVYSTASLASDVLRLRLSEQNNGGTGATYADYTIPALTASTWTHVSVVTSTPAASSAGTFPNDLNAVLSVSLIAVSDPGTVTVYLDDIRTTNNFTGDEDNQFSCCTYDDYMIVTNGVDQPKKYDGVVATGFQNLATTLAAGAITNSEIVIAIKDHIVFMNNTENGAAAPQRVSWGNIGALEDYVNGTAGYNDLTGDSDWIVAAKQLSEDKVAIYKERSIVVMEWVSGQTPFRFKNMYFGDGAIGKDAVENVGGEHAVMGNKYLYSYTGNYDITRVDVDINKTIYAEIDGTYQNRSFVLYDKSSSELQFWIPTSTAYPDKVYVIDAINKSWYIKSRTMNGFGHYVSQSTLTIGDLIGTIGDQNYRIGEYLTKANSPIVIVGDYNGKVYYLDKATFNNDGSAINNEFQTPDFTIPGKVSRSLTDAITPAGTDLESFFRVCQLVFEANGNSITTMWSDDSGVTWRPTSIAGGNTTTLSASYQFFQQDFDCTVRKIRFKFYNNSVSSGFKLRYYGFKWFPRSTRR